MVDKETASAGSGGGGGDGQLAGVEFDDGKDREVGRGMLR